MAAVGSGRRSIPSGTSTKATAPTSTPPAESDDEMTQLLFEPPGPDVLDLGEASADGYAGTRQRRPEQQFDETVHRTNDLTTRLR